MLGDDFIMHVLDHMMIYSLREDLNYKIGLISNVREGQDLKCSNKEILIVWIGIYMGTHCVSVSLVKKVLMRDLNWMLNQYWIG